MLSYCLKCKKNTESKIEWFSRQETEEYYLYQTVWFLVVKTRDLSKSKKLVDY